MEPPKTPSPDDLDMIRNMYRGAGTIFGTILAFTVMWPRHKADLWRRLIATPIAGWLGGFPIRENLLHWPPTLMNIVFAFAAAAFVSWPVMGTLVRIIEKWTPPKG